MILWSKSTTSVTIVSDFMIVANRVFLRDLPNFYYGRLTHRQWRVIVSALSEHGTEESLRLANDLIKFVLPPNETS